MALGALVACAAPGAPPVVVCTGPIDLGSQAALEAFTERGCTEVTGSLTVQATGLTLLRLAELRRIDGALYVRENASLFVVDLPMLSEVGFAQVTGNPSLAALALPSLALAGPVAIGLNPRLASVDLHGLQRVNGFLEVSGSEVPAALRLPALATVAGDLHLAGLALIDAPALGSVTGTLNLIGATALLDLRLPRLSRVDRLWVAGLSSLPALELPALAAIGAGLSVGENPGLEALSMPALATMAGPLEVYGNPALSALRVPALRDLQGPLAIRDNARLPQCQVMALVERLQAAGFGGVSITTGNDQAAACP